MPISTYYSRAAKEGLNVSLMERLDKLYGDEITYMLQVQYRYVCKATHMHTYIHIRIIWYIICICNTLHGRIKGKFSVTNVMLQFADMWNGKISCMHISVYNSFSHSNLHSNITLWITVWKILGQMFSIVGLNLMLDYLFDDFFKLVNSIKKQNSVAINVYMLLRMLLYATISTLCVRSTRNIQLYVMCTFQECVRST